MSAEQPHGSQLFADAFKKGLIRSGTDFEVYEKAGLKGLDLAFYRQRSRYHTKYDSVGALEGKESLWSMMQQAIGATEGLLAQGPRDREGGPPVYFDSKQWVNYNQWSLSDDEFQSLDRSCLC